MASYLTISCGPAHTSRRPSRNSLAGYLPKEARAEHRQVRRVKKTVPANNKFAALAIDTSVPRGSSFVGPRPSVAVAVQGSWGKKLTVSLSQAKPEGWKAPVQEKRYRKAPTQKRQAKPQQQGRPCAYCKEFGHHIRNCPVLAAKNARKTEWTRKNKARMQAEKQARAEARLAEQVRLAQEAKELAAQVVEQEDDSSDESDDEDFPELRAAIASGAVSTHRGEPKRKVSFKDDSENLMKPPCDIKVFNKEDPPKAISDDEEDKEEIVLTRSANAWKPKRLREEPKVLNQKTDQQQHDELLAIWKRDYAASTGSWADVADLADDLATINALRQDLGLPELDDDGEEIVEEKVTIDQFGRPSADNSAW